MHVSCRLKITGHSGRGNCSRTAKKPETLGAYYENENLHIFFIFLICNGLDPGGMREFAPQGREKITGQAFGHLALALPWVNYGPGQAPSLFWTGVEAGMTTSEHSSRSDIL